jgi:hypothetical protein
MPERNLEHQAARELEEAGYYVERAVRPAGPRKKGASDIIADLIAWGGDEYGELLPEVVVEVKVKRRGSSDAALAQLSRVAAVMGARRAFFFDGRWHEADPAFLHLNDSGCPQPVVPASGGRAPRRLIERELWTMLDSERGHRSTMGSEWVERVARAAEPEAGTPLSRLCLSKGSRRQLARILSEGAEERGIPEALADAMVRLLGPSAGADVLDPACGLGGTLWAVADACPGALLHGWWPNEGVVRAAQMLGSLCGSAIEVASVSFEEALARPASADAIISVPPFNVRLRERVRLADGSTSNDLDLVLLDRMVGWMKPGGRAVIALPPRLLFSESAAGVRARLVRDVRIVSVIELPPGIFQSTKIAVAILVLERRPATETLVARLREDWEAQLSPSGEFFAAFERHLKVSGS